MQISKIRSQVFVLFIVSLLFAPVEAINAKDTNNDVFMTTVVGKVVDSQTKVVVGATLLINGNTVGKSQIDGRFEIVNVETNNGAGVQVLALSNEAAGQSSSIPPQQGSITDVGVIVIVDCVPPLCTGTR